MTFFKEFFQPELKLVGRYAKNTNVPNVTLKQGLEAM
jgi:hypothetical protein